MSHADDFAEFWQWFPRKVGKLEAQSAYARARKRGVTPAHILDGVARYIEHKPAYADWCHPATWLNKGRYDDEYEVAARDAQAQTEDWFEECKRLHGGKCGLSQSAHYWQKVRDAG